MYVFIILTKKFTSKKLTPIMPYQFQSLGIAQKKREKKLDYFSVYMSSLQMGHSNLLYIDIILSNVLLYDIGLVYFLSQSS